MRRIQRVNRGTKLLNHENRIDVLERRIAVDYPHTYSLLLADIGPLTGFVSQDFGFSFGDPCGVGDAGCEDRFFTDSTYLYLPQGFNGVFEVTMQAGLQSGSVANYLTPVTPGDITPSNGLKIAFVAYIATDNVVDTGSFTIASTFVQNTQEPPPSRQGGYDRIWSHMRRVAGNNALTAADRWALRPFAVVLAGFGPVSLTGLVMSVTLFPPDGSFGDASWSG